MKVFGKYGKLAIGLVLAAQLAVSPLLGTRVQAAETDTPNLGLNSKSAILMEASTGQVLYEQNSDQPMSPASMAKMMTEYLILQSIDDKKINWTDMVPISEYSAVLSNNKALSGIPKAQGDQYSVQDLFYAVTIYSDNGAAVALAERISGSEEKFVQLMNDTAQKFGLSKDAHFIDTSGLDRVDLGKYAPQSIPGETIFTARDAALIAYHLLKDHPKILEYSSIPAKKFRPTDANPMINYDWMLEGNSNNQNFKKYVYPGVDGLKTGHTDKAGYCFTGTSQRNGTRLISVVMNASTRENSFLDTKKMFDYGFTNFEKKEIVKAGTPVDQLKAVPIKKGVNNEVAPLTGEGLTLFVKKDTPDSAFAKTAQGDANLVAPIKKGQQIGTLTVTYNNKPYTIKLVAANDEEKASWIRLLFRAIGNFFGDLFGNIKKSI
ncbi:peptidase M15 [Gordoniibacillus kamchatkensis]|uniref:serine-type D-Ala-D-Ala carboxypeptidase n=1 Tax=Gordoniibacillus kamchatkensis TaxID=1590651 RepID=A0ABR5AB93_9BACL|nr:D-alanyl-D-alanine carboxypeptidase family protein [Paenibacillus sp. VKM B-2647]KIL38167.1 peptidase M15 [Paenibacillus sp. VKM B-2647]